MSKYHSIYQYLICLFRKMKHVKMVLQFFFLIFYDNDHIELSLNNRSIEIENDEASSVLMFRQLPWSLLTILSQGWAKENVIEFSLKSMDTKIYK